MGLGWGWGGIGVVVGVGLGLGLGWGWGGIGITAAGGPAADLHARAVGEVSGRDVLLHLNAREEQRQLSNELLLLVPLPEHRRHLLLQAAQDVCVHLGGGGGPLSPGTPSVLGPPGGAVPSAHPHLDPPAPSPLHRIPSNPHPYPTSLSPHIPPYGPPTPYRPPPLPAPPPISRCLWPPPSGAVPGCGAQRAAAAGGRKR